MALLLVQSQPLPAALQSVSLRITSIEDTATYVITGEQFDPALPPRVQTVRPKGHALKGDHMATIARAIARDPQCVFVLARAQNPLNVQVSLLRAGIRRPPLIAGQ